MLRSGWCPVPLHAARAGEGTPELHRLRASGMGQPGPLARGHVRAASASSPYWVGGSVDR
eukprot:9045365-Alexandrium_andersonii.AAC.1